MTDIIPFHIEVGDEAIADLRERLTMARWPQQIAADWSRGQPVGFIRELCEHWRDRFDWRKAEAELNRYPQFLTEIDGQTIHFLHVRSKEPNGFPLVLTHGWPSSVAEFLRVIGPLTDPRSHGLDPSLSFDVVIPSLPGFGWSTPLSSEGWDAARTAKAWDTLMRRLGYSRYGAQGGDGGALVGRELGILKPEGLVGTHLQQIFAFPSGAEGEMDGITPFELAGFANLEKFQKYAGYSDIQSKRPATLGYGLVDSPVAQLAWNAELFFGFEGEKARTMDRELFLTHVSIYWFTGTGATASEFYMENAKTGAGYRDLPNETPTAVASFPDDFRTVGNFARRANNVVRLTEMPRGGHFAASEVPELLVEDVRAFFGGLL
jgi:pimeloyl-ACP methyl ester carboxylesterase